MHAELRAHIVESVVVSQARNGGGAQIMFAARKSKEKLAMWPATIDCGDGRDSVPGSDPPMVKRGSSLTKASPPK